LVINIVAKICLFYLGSAASYKGNESLVIFI